MADLIPAAAWSVVPQLETTTPALGGPGGVMNAQAQALLNRLAFLETDAGATKVGAKQARTAAALRTLQDRAQDTVSVTDFMSAAQVAAARGRTLAVDMTAAFQSALDACALTGANLRVPAGSYLLSSALVYSMTGLTADDDMRHVNVQGDGSSNTIVYTTATDLLQLTGGTGGTEGVNTYLTLSGLRLQKNSGATGSGIKLDRIAYLGMYDVQIYGFATGLDATNLLVAHLERVWLRGCAYGGYIRPAGANQYNPNAITIISSLIAGCSSWGLWIDKPGNVTMIGGAVEVCGTSGNAATGGLYFTNPGAESAVAFNLLGVYFEANRGGADVDVVHGVSQCVYNVIGCNFQRTDVAAFVVNPVRVTQTQSTLVLNLQGNGFRHFGGYTPSASRKYVAINSTGGSWQVNDETSYYLSATEAPVFAGPAQTRESRAAAFCVFNGSTSGTSPPSRGFNVSTVQRVSAGRYIVNYQMPLSSNNVCPSITSNGALIARLVNPTNALCEFVLETPAGVATDASYVSVTIFGV